MVWHYALLLMNSFNKTESAVLFLVQAILPEGFPFHQFNLFNGFFSPFNLRISPDANLKMNYVILYRVVNNKF